MNTAMTDLDHAREAMQMAEKTISAAMKHDTVSGRIDALRDGAPSDPGQRDAYMAVLITRLAVASR